MQKKPALINLITLVLLTIVGGCSSIRELNIFLPVPSPTSFPVVIAVLANDEINLPLDLRESFSKDHQPIQLNNAGDVSIDAILISREMLYSAQNNTELRSAMGEIIKNGKILLIYDASTVEIKEQLGIDMPTSGTSTTRYVISSVARIGNVIAAGSILVPKERDDPPGLADDARYYVWNLLLKIKEVNESMSTDIPFFP